MLTYKNRVLLKRSVSSFYLSSSFIILLSIFYSILLFSLFFLLYHFCIPVLFYICAVIISAKKGVYFICLYPILFQVYTSKIIKLVSLKVEVALVMGIFPVPGRPI